jgi:hypothetical protein
MSTAEISTAEMSTAELITSELSELAAPESHEALPEHELPLTIIER